MRNDFFKYVLLSGGSRQNRTEIESDTQPVTFKGNGHRLRNYRIYGNTVERKNLLKNTAISKTVNGVTFTVNDDGSVTCNGTATATTSFELLKSVNVSENVVLSGCPIGGSVNSYLLRFISLSPTIIDEDLGSGKTIINHRTGGLEIRIASGYTCDNLTFYPMIRKADIEDDTYEPYIQNTSVGDLQKNGKYLVPVTVQGKNWYNINQYSLTEGQVIYGATGQLVTNPSYSATVDYIPCTDISGNKMILNKSPGKYAPGIAFYDADKKFISGVINNGRATGTPITFDVPENAVFMRFSVPVNETEIQIEYGSVATAYEPYHEPQTVNITLDAPLTADEYIDFRTQKRYPSGDIAELSPLPTIDGTNIITVDTETAPSKVYVQGNISSVETVENVQTNTLQSQLLNISALDLTDEPQTVQEQGGEDSGYTDT